MTTDTASTTGGRVPEELGVIGEFEGPRHAAGNAAVDADTTSIAGFGQEATVLAEQLRSAALHTRDGDPTPLGPAFGAVGAAFVAALVATHDAHGRDLERLGDALAGMGSAAAASAAAYERSVQAVARRLTATQDES
ncbi:hypothetical protein ACIBED_06660 [Rhodococcus coprophilus]|uniref:hypothetical protein n=1 Tax=Rhodococcus coprophilus TaxID=38310 RepID=UPI001DC1FF48|nr:hypothetical protein [Rhodococcus coprophilus]MBM7460046.1 homoserine kinase [Rhodococcus coprophilus]